MSLGFFDLFSLLFVACFIGWLVGWDFFGAGSVDVSFCGFLVKIMFLKLPFFPLPYTVLLGSCRRFLPGFVWFCLNVFTVTSI